MIRQVLGKLSFRTLSAVETVNRRFLSLQSGNGPSTTGNSLPPLFLSPMLPKISPIPTHLPLNIGQTSIVNPWIAPMRETPSLSIIPDKTDEDPRGPPLTEKQAARMVVIRRKKMKKHKLRKLRKVRKFEYRRVALKRKTLKEKTFQMKLMDQIKQAEQFDPKAYVEYIINTAKEETVVVPKRIPGHKYNPSLYDEKGHRIDLQKFPLQKK